MLGVGGASHGFVLSKEGSEAPFPQVISTGSGLPVREVSVAGVIVEAALSWQYMPARGPLVGIQVGYLRSLGAHRD
ncbi:MAG: hypothetical protein RMK19_00295 [Bacteroidia bacterium]|nr:hypothetical protein [Bacteroidia bacterium]MDW8014436.1 hypothetical protein [Bacteroidia bacterium]